MPDMCGIASVMTLLMFGRHFYRCGLDKIGEAALSSGM